MEFKRYYRSSNLILASCLGESRGKIVLWRPLIDIAHLLYTRCILSFIIIFL